MRIGKSDAHSQMGADVPAGAPRNPMDSPPHAVASSSDVAPHDTPSDSLHTAKNAAAAPLNTSMRLKAVTNSFAVIIAQTIYKASTYIAFILVSLQLTISDFGLYNLVFAIGQMLNSVASFGLDSILIRKLAQHDAREKRKRLLRDALILKLASSALAGAILLDGLLWLRASSDLVFGMAIMVGDLIVVNLTATLTCYDRARLRSTGPTVVQSSTRVVYLALLVAAGPLHIPWYGLLEVLLIADTVACGALAWHIGRHVRNVEAAGASERFNMFREALPLGVAAVGTLLYTRLDTVLIANLRNVSEVAYYSASYKLTEAPMMIITAITATVLPLISAWSMTGDWRERVGGGSQRALRYAYVLALFAAVVVTFYGRFIVHLLYGSRYTSILPTVTVLIWATVAMGSNNISAIILTGMGRQRLLMFIVGINIMVNIAVNLWAIPQWGYFGSAIATTATEGVNMVVQITTLCILLRRPRLAWTTFVAIMIGVGNLAVYFGTGAHPDILMGIAAIVALVICLIVTRLVTLDDVHVVRRLGARLRRGSSVAPRGV